MDAGMDEAARMAVRPLVQILIRRLQIEIGDRVLEHENGDGGEGEEDELRHRRYFDMASAVPSQCGGRRVDPEIGDALAIERVELVEARGVQLLAFAGERFGRVPVLGAEAGEKLAVTLGERR